MSRNPEKTGDTMNTQQTQQDDAEMVNELSRQLDDFEKRLDAMLDRLAQKSKTTGTSNSEAKPPLTPDWLMPGPTQSRWDKFHMSLSPDDRYAVVTGMNFVWKKWQHVGSGFVRIENKNYPNFKVATTVNGIREFYDLTDCIRAFTSLAVAEDTMQGVVILYKF